MRKLLFVANIYFTLFSNVSIVDFEQVNVSWVIFFSSSTKYSVVASILIILQQQNHIQIDLPILLCCLFIASAFLQIVMLLTEMRDPFEPIENLFAMILLRGPEEIVKETKKKTE